MRDSLKILLLSKLYLYKMLTMSYATFESIFIIGNMNKYNSNTTVPL